MDASGRGGSGGWFEAVVLLVHNDLPGFLDLVYGCLLRSSMVLFRVIVYRYHRSSYARYRVCESDQEHY